MSFLKKAAREEDLSNESGQLEEQYMKMFPKIGRDFVHKEDLSALLNAIMFLLDPLGLNPLDVNSSEAVERAKEYRAYLDKDKKGSDVYKDLINLDEDQ